MSDSVDVKRTQSPEVTDAEAWEISLVGKIMKSLSKAVTNMRFYLPNNPLVRRSKTELYEEIDRFLQAWNTLSLDITDKEILFRGSPVYEGGDKARSLTFLLYRDGLRRISLHRGLDDEELEAFLEVICQAMNRGEEETDIVGSLWEADFPNIDYGAVEVFVDVEEGPMDPPAGDKSEAARFSGGAEDRSDSPVSSVPAPSRVLESDAIRHVDERVEWESFARINPEEIRTKVQSMAEFSPWEILSSLLLDLIELEDDLSDRNHLLDLMGEYVKELCSQEKFDHAGAAIESTRRALEKAVSEPEHVKQLLSSFSEKINLAVSSESTRKAIKEAFPRMTTEILDFLELVGGETIPVLIELVPVAEDVKSRAALRAALSVLASKDISSLSAAIYHQDSRIVREAVAVIGRIGDPAGTKMLRPCLKHADVSVRIQVLHALQKIGDAESTRVTLEFLDDQDQEVRILAAKTIDLARDPTAMETVEGMVARRSFGLRPTREKIALVDALKRTGSDQIVPILATFFRRGLFRRKEEDSVVTAIVGALSSIGTEAANKILERGSRWKRKAIAAACLRALQQFPVESTQGEIA